MLVDSNRKKEIMRNLSVIGPTITVIVGSHEIDLTLAEAKVLAAALSEAVRDAC